MNDLKSFEHGEEGTPHYICEARLSGEGGQITCCGCSSHDCKSAPKVKPLVIKYGLADGGSVEISSASKEGIFSTCLSGKVTKEKLAEVTAEWEQREFISKAEVRAVIEGMKREGTKGSVSPEEYENALGYNAAVREFKQKLDLDEDPVGFPQF